MQTQADYISSAFPGIDGHAISLLTAKKAIGYTAALTKSILHGIVRGAINVIQSGGKFLSSFASGFVSSAFAVGKKTFGEGAVAARTAIMALVGGVTSELTGGKFLNGAVSAAFVHLFNSEADNWSSSSDNDEDGDGMDDDIQDGLKHMGPWVDSHGVYHLGFISAPPKPALSSYKKALSTVHAKVGRLPKGKRGKFGSPQAGNSKVGYRLDPPHQNNGNEKYYHINYWDYTGGKRGTGRAVEGAVPIY